MMTMKEARAEATRRWYVEPVVGMTNGYARRTGWASQARTASPKYTVGCHEYTPNTKTEVARCQRGSSDESWEAAFADADLRWDGDRLRGVREQARLRAGAPLSAATGLLAKALQAIDELPGVSGPLTTFTRRPGSGERFASTTCESRDGYAFIDWLDAMSNYVPALLEELCQHRIYAAAFAEAVDAAREAAQARGHGGQHVPFFDSFSGASPSVLIELERWARRLTDIQPVEDKKS